MRKFFYIVPIITVFFLLSAIFWGCSHESEQMTSPAVPTDALTQHAGALALDMSCAAADAVAETTNREFQVTFKGVDYRGNLATYTYQICKQGQRPQTQDLRHWVLGLDQFFPYLAEDMTMSDFYVNCGILETLGGETCELSVLDTATQVMGVKFKNLRLGDDQCQTYLITLDTTTLAPEFALGTGVVLIATKSGEQDVTTSSTPLPGYACATGPGIEKILR